MKSTLTFAVVAILLVAVLGVSANGGGFNEPFNNNLTNAWHPTVFEGGTFSETYCSLSMSVCSNLVNEGPDKYLRFTMTPDIIPGYYTDMEYRSSPEAEGLNNGPWTPQVGSPVVFEARLRMPGRNFDGSGDAVGTAGVGLWNNAAGADVNPNTDFILFAWAMDETTDFLQADGFRAFYLKNLFQYVGSFVPPAFDITNWFEVRIVWSVDETGQQSITYAVNDVEFASAILPEPMQGLSITLWEDNSLWGDDFLEQFLIPPQSQFLDIDYVRVRNLS